MTAPGNGTLDRARAVSVPASLGRWLLHPLPWLGLALLALPFFVSVIGMTDVAATKLAIFFLVAIGFNVLLGYTGLVSFGHSIFFGFGAYATALLQIHVFKGGFWLPILVAVLLCLVLGFAIGLLILRRGGVYFSLLTLAFTAMAFYIVYRWTSFTGGEDGLRGLVRPAVFGFDINDSMTYYWLVSGFVFLAGAGLWRLVNSPLGRVFVAIRENEQRAEFLGYRVMLYKLISFAISATVVGLGGALYAMLFYIVTPEIVHVAFSGEILAMAVLGGSGSFLGPAVGAFVYILFQDVLAAYTSSWQLWFGLLFIGFVLFSPEGIVGAAKRIVAMARKEAVGIAAMAARVTPPEQWALPPSLARAASQGGDEFLIARGLTKRFGAFTAVDRVDLDFREHEFRVVIGPNGAGKTTLFNLLTGMHRAEEGTLTYLGRAMNGRPTKAFPRAGLCRSFQIVNLFEQLTVEENIRLAVQARHRERYNPLRRADRIPQVAREADEIIAFTGLKGMEPARVADLSGGGKRLLEIAIALASRPRVLFLDEPLAGLAAAERSRFAKLIKLLSKSITVVMIEHDMDHAFDIAERITVMHAGRILADGTPEEVRDNRLVQDIYLGRGRGAASELRSGTLPVRSPVQPLGATGAPVLALANVNTFYGTSQILHDVGLKLRAGEIVGLLGRNGAGKSTTIKSIMGLAPARSGTISIGDRDLTRLPPQEVARHGIGYVPQGRRLFGTLTVAENLEIGGMRRHTGEGLSWTFDQICAFMPKLRLLMHRKAGVLSGGEQQMVAIARALSGNLRVLLLDEPFEGLAPAVVDEVFDAVSRLREAVPIIIVEHDLDRVLALVDRVYVLDRGTVVHEGPARPLLDDLEYRKKILWL